MARKKHLINVHTSTGTTAPTGASLYLGEIAVQHTPNDSALWIKVGSAETSTEYEKFIGKTEIINLLEDTKILGSGYTYSGLSYINSSTTIADAFSALTNEMLKDEKVVAAALNDLNGRVDEISAATGDITELFEYLQENEEVVAGALNDLNERIGTVETQMTGDYIPITGYQTATGTSEEELSLEETDTVNEALGKLQKQMLDNEESIAAGLNDLNTRLNNVDDIIAHNTGITQLSGAVKSFSAATYYELGDVWDELQNKASNNDVSQLSAATHGKINQLSGATQYIGKSTLTISLNGAEQGKYTPSSGNTTISLTSVTNGSDVLLTGYELATGTTEKELAIVPTDTVNEAFGKIQKQNYDNEAVVAGALNDLDERITTLEVSGSSSDDLEALSAKVLTNEYVVAAALNDLNARIVDLSGNTGGGSEVLVTQELTAGTLIATISVDGNATDLYAPTGGGGGGNYDALSAATHTHVTNNDIHVTSSQKTSWTNGSNSGASAYTAVTALSAATTGINNTLTAHTADTTVHVTQANKNTWNGKQDAISDLATIRNGANSGASAYTAVTALSAATTGINNTLTAHTNNGDIHVTSAQKTNWTNSGTSGANAYVGYIAHSANTGIHVTTSDKNTWNGKQDAISDLATIRNNASSGATAYSNVNSLSAATTAMSANVAKIAVTGVTVDGTGNAITGATYSSSALTLTKGNVLTAETLTGVSAVGTALTVTNKVANIPSASPSTFGVVKVGNFLSSNTGTLSVITGTNNTSVARGDHSHSEYATTGTVNSHSATTIPSRTSAGIHLPTVTSSDNYKIPMVSGGTWTLTPVAAIYTGSGQPAQNMGNDGDIYLQTS